MRKVFLTLFAVMTAAAAWAEDYAYLVFETKDGVKTSVAVESITITIADGKLTASGQEFSLSNLSKMYFSASDVTGVRDAAAVSGLQSGKAACYDLSGRRIDGSPSSKGVFIVKMNDGKTKKVVVR